MISSLIRRICNAHGISTELLQHHRWRNGIILSWIWVKKKHILVNQKNFEEDSSLAHKSPICQWLPQEMFFGGVAYNFFAFTHCFLGYPEQWAWQPLIIVDVSNSFHLQHFYSQKWSAAEWYRKVHHVTIYLPFSVKYSLNTSWLLVILISPKSLPITTLGITLYIGLT